MGNPRVSAQRVPGDIDAHPQGCTSETCRRILAAKALNTCVIHRFDYGTSPMCIMCLLPFSPGTRSALTLGLRLHHVFDVEALQTYICNPVSTALRRVPAIGDTKKRKGCRGGIPSIDSDKGGKNQSLYFLTMMVALWPPKPNVLDSAAFTVRFCALSKVKLRL